MWRVFRERPEILRYQLVQQARDRFELRVVTAHAPTGDEAAADAADELRGVLGGADVELARCDDLPAGPGGKFRHLVPLAGEVAAAGSPAQEGLAERAASPGCRRSL